MILCLYQTRELVNCYNIKEETHTMAYQSKSNRKFLATTLTAAMVASAVAPAASAASTFPDVKEGSLYYEYVSALAEAGIIDGRPDGSFDLGGKLNRAEAAKMISKIIKLDTTDAPASSFEDVKEDVWYTDYINALYAEGLIDGVSETTFAPNQELTRAQLAKLVVDAYGLEIDASAEHPFTDVKEDVWYTDYIKTLYKHELIDGKTATTFAPNEPIKRADFAKLLTEADWAVGDTLEKPMPEEAMVTGVSAINLKTVEVTFGQEIDESTVVTANFMKDGLPVDSVELSKDKKKVTVGFATAVTNKSNIRLTVENVKTTTDEDVKAYDSILYVEDSAKPVVSSTQYVKALDELTVSFSEELTSVGTVVVKDDKGVSQVAPKSYTAAGGLVIDTSSLEDGKTYTVSMVGATDLAGNYFENNNVTFAFNTGSDDKTAPAISSVKAVGKDKIEVAFTEKLAILGTLDGNTLVKDSNLDTTYDYSVDESGKVVTIKVPNMTNNTFVTYDFAGQKDLAGNAITAISKTVSYVDQAAPALASTTVNGKVVTLEFNEDVTLAGGTTAKLYAPNGVVKTIANGKLSVSGKKVMVDLAADVATAIDGSYRLAFDKDAITDGESNSAAYTTSFSLKDSSDTTKATVVDLNGAAAGKVLYDAAAGTVKVQYSEGMSASAINANNYSVDGVNVFESAYFDNTTDMVVLKLKSDAFSFDANRVFKIKGVSDVAGNLSNEYSETINFTDNTAPTLMSAVLASDGTKVTLTFSENLDTTTIDNVAEAAAANSDFTVLIDGVARSVAGGEVVGSNDRTYTLTFDSAIAPADISKTITVKTTDVNDVEDTSGNSLAAISSFTVTK